MNTRGTSRGGCSLATTHNLPPQLTPFIGRVEEIAEINRLLVDPACRLLTLVGPGGSGKTRLAIEAAARQPGNTFPDGVYFVPLQPLSSPGDIIPTIANALRFCFVGESEPRQQLLNYLRERRLLLVLDNFEHLLGGTGLVLDLLETALGAKTLVTSRETLNLRGEWTYYIKGMCTPGDGHAETLESYDAVQLFVECARRVQGSFSLADEQADVIRLCQLVEGMPLAIELAAPWVKTLTCASIADEIQHDIDFLATSLRDMPERHRSIRVAFDHSWRLLTEEERAVFQKLSVFRGGFEREAAERVTGASLPTLAALVDKCFLYKEPSGRYQVHELLRQYGEERLKEVGETDAARSAHCAYYADFMQQREADIKGRRQQGALDEIETDLENVRAAWHWALKRRDYDAINRSLESLHWCLNNMRSRLQEGEELFRRAREGLAPQPGDPPHPVWGRVVVRHEEIFRYRREGAGAAIERCFAIAQRHGDRAEIAFCLKALGQHIINCGDDFNEALSYYEQGLAHYRDLGDDFYVAEMLQGIGVCYESVKQLDNAAEFYRQSAELARSIGNEIGMVWVLMLMGWIAMSTGNYAEGERRLREASIIQRETGHKYGYASTTPSLGWLAFYKGNFKEAKALAEEAFDISTDYLGPFGHPWDATGILGLVACMEEDYTTGKQYYEDILIDWPNSPEANWGLSVAACGLEDYSAARQHMQAVLQSSYVINYDGTMGLIRCLPAIAMILAHEGEPEQAVELLALAFTPPASLTGWMERWPLLTRFRASLGAELGAEAFEAAWVRGETSDLKAVIAGVLRQFAESEELVDAVVPLVDQPLIEPLSERELEVLGLMAEGLSNREIAARLYLAVGTVKVHASNIYSKLDVSNRTQAVARARKLALL